jgi:hypothetical protein
MYKIILYGYQDVISNKANPITFIIKDYEFQYSGSYDGGTGNGRIVCKTKDDRKIIISTNGVWTIEEME